MTCIRCKGSVIGNLPGHLYVTRLCQKCYQIYLTEQPSGDEKADLEKKETEIKKAEDEEDERIDNRFDILDM